MKKYHNIENYTIKLKYNVGPISFEAFDERDESMKRITLLALAIFLLMISTLNVPKVFAHQVTYVQRPYNPPQTFAHRYNFTIFHNGWLNYSGLMTPQQNGQPIRGFFIDSNPDEILLIGSPAGWTGYQVDSHLIVWNITNTPGQYQIANGNSLDGFAIETNGQFDGNPLPFFVHWATLHTGDIHDTTPSNYLDHGIIG